MEFASRKLRLEIILEARSIKPRAYRTPRVSNDRGRNTAHRHPRCGTKPSATYRHIPMPSRWPGLTAFLSSDLHVMARRTIAEACQTVLRPDVVGVVSIRPHQHPPRIDVLCNAQPVALGLCAMSLLERSLQTIQTLACRILEMNELRRMGERRSSWMNLVTGSRCWSRLRMH